jgi:4-deoxy-L-threo-5-hexosulose-uronate ketol-isomerase
MSTAELRGAFLVERLFEPGAVNLTLTDLDRAVVGAAVPTTAPLELPTIDKLRCEFLCQRRELGILNIGASGTVDVDGDAHALAPLDCLYVGLGSRNIRFASDHGQDPAQFYLLSYPAHHAYPTTLIRLADANPIEVGDAALANCRTIHQYIHEGGARSCQLVMGYTQLKPGSVWNTMPCHTHQRRSEIYLYFNLLPGHQALHIMGEPQATRTIWVPDRAAVLSPPWSIHSAVGTSPYSFAWGMGGENQRFDDMDPVAVCDLC